MNQKLSDQFLDDGLFCIVTSVDIFGSSQKLNRNSSTSWTGIAALDSWIDEDAAVYNGAAAEAGHE